MANRFNLTDEIDRMKAYEAKTAIPLPNLPHWAFADKHDLVPSEVRTDIKRYGESYAAAVSADRDAQIAALRAEVAGLRKALRVYLDVYENVPDAIDRYGEWFQTDEAKHADTTARAALGDKT